MWGFDWEPVIAAGVTGVLALVGVVLTVWHSGRTTRQRGLDQHNEQNEKLDKLLAAHDLLDKKVDRNNMAAVNGITAVQNQVSDIKGHISGLQDTNGVLFGMIVELDKKVTKPSNRKTKIPTLEETTS